MSIMLLVVLRRNTASLFVIQIASYLGPLITLPWLARVLGPEGMGVLGIGQGIVALVALLVEYGFAFSAAQEVGVHRDDPQALSRILAGVLGAKLLLAALSAVCLLMAGLLMPGLRAHLPLGVWCWFFGVMQALQMTWFLLALDRMGAVAISEASLRLLSACAIVSLVRAPGDEWKVFAIQGTALMLSALNGAFRAWSGIAWQFPLLAMVTHSLKQGRAMLLFRSMEAGYTSATALLLAFVCPIGVVGAFSGAERLARIVLSAGLDPIQRSVYPAVASALTRSRVEAAAIVRHSAVLTVSIGVGACSVLWLAAPAVIRLTLGEGYEDSIPALRVLLLVPIGVALKWAMGLNWMVPLGDSATFNLIVACSGLLYVVLAIVLSQRWAHVGMAVAVTATEIFVPFCVWMVLRSRSLDPLSIGRNSSSQEAA